MREHEGQGPLDERDAVYTEVALWVFARGAIRATGRQLFRELSDTGKAFVASIHVAPDEHPADIFFEDIHGGGVVEQEEVSGNLVLGKLGKKLVEQYFDQLDDSL